MAQDSRPCKGCGAPIKRTAPVAPIRHYCSPDCRPRCVVDGCVKPQHSKAMCGAHAARAKRYGNPLGPLMRGKNDGPCSVDGCDQPMRKRGWCASHYSQWRRTGNIKQFAYKWAPQGSVCVVCGDLVKPGGRRRKHCSHACQAQDSRHQGQRPKSATCAFCGKDFDLRIRTSSGRLQRVDTIWCPDCGRDSPEVQRFRRYGVTAEQFRAAQEAGCSICGATGRTLHVDHDHACCPNAGGGGKPTCGKCVRGFICGACNRGLGLFFDDPAALVRAAAYLTEAHKRTRGARLTP